MRDGTTRPTSRTVCYGEEACLTRGQHRPPYVRSSVARYPEVFDQQADDGFQGNTHRREVHAAERHARRQVCEGAPDLHMSGRVQVGRMAEVVVAEDPTLAVGVGLVLNAGLLYFEAHAPGDSFAVETDGEAEKSPIRQWQGIIGRLPTPKRHPPLAGGGLGKEAYCPGPVEDGDAEQKRKKIAEGFESVAASGLIPGREGADVAEEGVPVSRQAPDRPAGADRRGPGDPQLPRDR